MIEPNDLHERLIDIVGRAGAAILEVYATDFEVTDNEGQEGRQ